MKFYFAFVSLIPLVVISCTANKNVGDNGVRNSVRHYMTVLHDIDTVLHTWPTQNVIENLEVSDLELVWRYRQLSVDIMRSKVRLRAIEPPKTLAALSGTIENLLDDTLKVLDATSLLMRNSSNKNKANLIEPPPTVLVVNLRRLKAQLIEIASELDVPLDDLASQYRSIPTGGPDKDSN